MKKIVDYNIIQSNDLQTLITLVKNALQFGWIPKGGICQINTLKGEMFIQTVVKTN